MVQDIQFALAYRKPLRLSFRPFDERLYLIWERECAPMERCWTHKAIWILAEAITLCYGGHQTEGVDPGGLKSKIQTWESEMPGTLRPTYFSPADLASRRPFPVVLFTNPSHGMYRIPLFWQSC